jgi:hypothetical protein
MTITLVQPMTSHWEVELTSGKVLNERETKTDLLKGMTRLVDWSLDLVATGDVRHIKQLRMYCPDVPLPVVLDITESGTAFQLKVGNVSIGGGGHSMIAQIIGKVTNKETGDCECYVWDWRRRDAFAWSNNVYDMGTWSESIMPIGTLALNVLGIDVA